MRTTSLGQHPVDALVVHAVTFGETMRALMAERGISLRSLAKTIPADVGHLSRISRDLKTPSQQMAQSIDKALGAAGDLAALRPHTRLRQALDGEFTPDDEERLSLALQRPARLDAGALGALATILAGQRRLEDAIGPAALLGPVTTQARTIAAVLRETTGPHRDEFGRIVAEWTVYAGWLHATLRRDAHALELFGLGEDLADDFDYGTGAALATSFRGYVARQQDRPRAVVRAATAALATPGVHQSQKTYDTLQAAQGYAALGERDEARRLLDAAADLADDAGEPPPPVYWYSKPFFRLNIGVVQAAIGEYRDAVDMLASGLEEMPADQRSAEWVREYDEALADAKSRA